MRQKRFDIEEAAKRLGVVRELCFTDADRNEVMQFCAIIRSVSRSGMSRVICLYLLKGGELWLIGEGCVHGVGMDMVWDTANSVCWKHFSYDFDNFRTRIL